MFDVEQSHRPETLKEALEILDQREGVFLLAGGTDLLVKMKEERISPKVLMDLRGIKDLRTIHCDREWIEIGSGVTFRQIEDEPLFDGPMKALKMAAAEVGSPQIRNMATLGGNLCNASPAADFIPNLLALDAEICLQSLNGERRMKAEGFLLGKGRVDRRSNEILISIGFPPLKTGRGLGFYKLGCRKALAIAKLVIAVYLETDGKENIKEIRIASGSVGIKTLRESHVEEFFRGKKVSPGLMEDGARVFSEEIQRRLGTRHGGIYKGISVKAVFKRAFEKALESKGEENE